MKTTAIVPADLWRSVIAVPPMARRPDGTPCHDNNRKIVTHLASGGVTTLLWGGNANIYNMALSEYEGFLDMLEAIADPDSWMIPSVGADYGKAWDQLTLMRGRAFPTAMVLPLAFPTTSRGVATGLRKLADRYGKPVVAYIKSEGYVTPEDLAGLDRDGVLASIKYANVRKDPSDDPFLAELVEKVDPRRLVSGIGERPVISHLTKFGLSGFTSGSVCIAPALSTAILRALKSGDVELAGDLRKAFLPLEDLRDGHSPIRVLHQAITAAGIADTGQIGPFLAPIDDPDLVSEIAGAARDLLLANTKNRSSVAAE